MMSTQPDFKALREHLKSRIVGQEKLLDRLLVGILTGGHLLLEGPPGLAKTRAVNALASGVHSSFQRIQFTPDLMPGDLTGSDIYDQQANRFRFIPGPIFHQIVLADEINRAPPKVQSALLEAMAEHQVTVGGITHPLPELFIVMATQNPLEQSGTYPLPEAQLDRFQLHVVLDYPSDEEELEILQMDRATHFDHTPPADTPPLQPETALRAQHEVTNIHVAESLERYIVKLVSATRHLGELNPEWKDYLVTGVSPRASISLLRASSAHAYLQGRDHVLPDDIIEIAPDVLRHRLLLDYPARAAGMDADTLVRQLLAGIPAP